MFNIHQTRSLKHHPPCNLPRVIAILVIITRNNRLRCRCRLVSNRLLMFTPQPIRIKPGPIPLLHRIEDLDYRHLSSPRSILLAGTLRPLQGWKQESYGKLRILLEKTRSCPTALGTTMLYATLIIHLLRLPSAVPRSILLRPAHNLPILMLVNRRGLHIKLAMPKNHSLLGQQVLRSTVLCILHRILNSPRKHLISQVDMYTSRPPLRFHLRPHRHPVNHIHELSSAPFHLMPAACWTSIANPVYFFFFRIFRSVQKALSD
jgi:hypothetical protein